MSEYNEQDRKLTFSTSSNRNINLSVDCQLGTIAEVSFYTDELKTVGCGDTVKIGNSDELKNKRIEFNGASGNPESNPVKVIHTIEEEEGEKISYTFPDDYTGTPEFNEDDQEPSYVFYVHFT